MLVVKTCDFSWASSDMFSYVGVVSQPAPAATLQLLQWHMGTRLKWSLTRIKQQRREVLPIYLLEIYVINWAWVKMAGCLPCFLLHLCGPRQSWGALQHKWSRKPVSSNLNQTSLAKEKSCLAGKCGWSRSWGLMFWLGSQLEWRIG